MRPLFVISLLTILVLTSEMPPLAFLVLITVTFVFLMVASYGTLPLSGLTSFLVMLLYYIISIFISTHTILVFFIMYELSLLPVCLLILIFGYQPEKIKSMLYLLVYTVVCSAPLFFYTITLNTSIISGFSVLGDLASTIVCLSFMVKSPIYALHSWLPKAHVEAPLVGSMLLAGVILKLGSYGILLLAPYLTTLTSIFIYLTLSGSVVCSVICCRA